MIDNKNIQILDYLNNLTKNNNREWFQANKNKYDELKEFFILQTAEMIEKIAQFDDSVMFEDPKKCIFRINRDIRFSKDKSPYKSNFGAFVVPGGKKSGNAGYYLHLDISGCFIAGGVHNPQTTELKKLRWYIYENITEFLQIIGNEKFNDNFGSIVGEKLKNQPKDFNKNFEHIELLKYKEYTVMRKIDDKFLADKNFVNNMIDKFRIMSAFIKFLNKALA